MDSYCKSCGIEIPDDPTTRQPPGMEPDLCKWCDPELGQYDLDERKVK